MTVYLIFLLFMISLIFFKLNLNVSVLLPVNMIFVDSKFSSIMPIRNKHLDPWHAWRKVAATYAAFYNYFTKILQNKNMPHHPVLHQIPREPFRTFSSMLNIFDVIVYANECTDQCFSFLPTLLSAASAHAQRTSTNFHRRVSVLSA